MAGVQAATSLGGSLLNNNANQKAVEAQNRGNMELAKYQNDRNMELWNMQNSYNAPSAQMARYKEAGLNPNLIYGSGSSAGVAPPPPKTEAPQLQAYSRNDFGLAQASETALSSMLSVQQLENLKAQNAAVKASANKTNLEAAGLVISNSRNDILRRIAEETQESVIEGIITDTRTKNLRNDIGQIDFQAKNLSLKIAKDLYDAGMPIATAQAKLSQIETSVANMKQNMDFAKFEQDLKRIGIYPGDQLWERILGRVVEGLFGGNAIKNFLNPFKK